MDDIRLCRVQQEYINKMRSIDQKVGNPDICYIVPINGVSFAVPLVYNLEADISIIGVLDDEFDKCEAKLSFSTMFPVTEDVLVDVPDGYEMERRFISHSKREIVVKAADIYMRRYCKSDPDYILFKTICCDFRRLEKSAM